MTKLLNNKYAVIGLVVAACGVIYFRAVEPAMEFFFPEQIEADVFTFAEQDHVYDPETSSNYEESPERELQFASEQFNLTKIDISGLRWNEMPSRDPFSGAKLLEPVRALVDSIPAKFVNPSEIRLPRVSAIVSAPKLKFAVIEGEILKEGDRYGNFVLKKIEDEQVSVVQILNQQWHRLSVTE